MKEPLILKREDACYVLRPFEKYGVRALFTTKKYDMGFACQPSHVKAGRRHAYLKLGIHWQDLVCPSQVHGKAIFVAEEKHRGAGALERSEALKDTDAVVTNRQYLPISILTADCLPVFILDPNRRTIALVHAGWRGVHQRLIKRTIEKMEKTFNARPEDLQVAFGPAIRLCCYEVGKDFKKYFAHSLVRRRDALYFDIAAAAARQLKEAGVKDRHLYDTRLCTACSDREFFSYRREKETAGRGMSVMELLEARADS